MIERNLSKTQTRIFAALSQQRQELMEAVQEIQQAQQEQLEMLRKQYDLPEGEYRLRQEPDGSVVMFAEPPKPDEEEESEEATDASS